MNLREAGWKFGSIVALATVATGITGCNTSEVQLDADLRRQCRQGNKIAETNVDLGSGQSAYLGHQRIVVINPGEVQLPNKILLEEGSFVVVPLIFWGENDAFGLSAQRSADQNGLTRLSVTLNCENTEAYPPRPTFGEGSGKGN